MQDRQRVVQPRRGAAVSIEHYSKPRVTTNSSYGGGVDAVQPAYCRGSVPSRVPACRRWRRQPRLSTPSSTTHAEKERPPARGVLRCGRRIGVSILPRAVR
eukprot:1539961-Pleurochrysis_carterae.AAC.1